MKMTLLELTQNILSSMDSDEVNSYSDTTESRQVAEIIRTAYYNIIARAQLPEHQDLFSLDASGDTALPVLMYKPENVRKIEWIKYDKSDSGVASEPEYDYVTFLPLAQFLNIVHKLDPDETNVDSLTLNDHIYYYRNDIAPTYYTVIGDYNILFDAYNEDVDDTLQETKTICFGQIQPTFTLDDDFTPDLDAAQFPLLLNEAKSLAFLELKQMTNEKAEQESRRQWRTTQHTKKLQKTSPFDELPHFGRK